MPVSGGRRRRHSEEPTAPGGCGRLRYSPRATARALLAIFDGPATATPAEENEWDGWTDALERTTTGAERIDAAARLDVLGLHEDASNVVTTSREP